MLLLLSILPHAIYILTATLTQYFIPHTVGTKLNTFRFSIVNISWMLEWSFYELDLANIV